MSEWRGFSRDSPFAIWGLPLGWGVWRSWSSRARPRAVVSGLEVHTQAAVGAGKLGAHRLVCRAHRWRGQAREGLGAVGAATAAALLGGASTRVSNPRAAGSSTGAPQMPPGRQPDGKRCLEDRGNSGSHVSSDTPKTGTPFPVAAPVADDAAGALAIRRNRDRSSGCARSSCSPLRVLLSRVRKHPKTGTQFTRCAEGAPPHRATAPAAARMSRSRRRSRGGPALPSSQTWRGHSGARTCKRAACPPAS